MRAKICETDRLHKELWSSSDGQDLVFEVVEEAFVKDALKIKAKK